MISSQPRYDHFDTSPCKKYSVFGENNMISSQARYDHFDTLPYMYPGTRIRDGCCCTANSARQACIPPVRVRTDVFPAYDLSRLMYITTSSFFLQVFFEIFRFIFLKKPVPAGGDADLPLPA